MTQIASKRLHHLPAKVLGLPIVAQGEAGHPQVEIRRDLELKIVNRRGDGLAAQAERAGFRRVTSDPEIVAHVGRDPPEPSLITERPSQAFGGAEMPEARLELPQWE